MLYIVDGTGPLSDTQYAVSMAGSHCAVLHHLNKPKSLYFRGPDLWSAIKTTGGIADTVLQAVMQEEFPPALLAPGQRQAPKSKIFLVGHSRGGAAVVKVAQKLDEKGITVAGMFLFDAVDRTVFLDSVQTVPKNVALCFHAMRNEGAEVVMGYETDLLWKKCTQSKGFAELQDEHRRIGSGPFIQFLLFRSASASGKWPELANAVRVWQQKSQNLGRLKVAMRNSLGLAGAVDGSLELSLPFGNCATRFDPRCKAETTQFACSHGAIGGTPWTNLGSEIEAIDKDGAKRAWTWMASRLIQCGVRAGKSA